MKDPNNIDRIVFIVTIALILLMMHSYSLVAKEKPQFVLVLYSDNAYNDASYVGTFYSCDVAHRWIQLHYANPWLATRCLHQDYMNLPIGFEHRYIDLIDMSQFARKPFQSGRD